MRTYGITRKHRPYELQEHDPSWKEKFEEYSEKIKPILGENLISIEHMGSTAIEGMVAKPQIDILVVVKDLEKIPDTYNSLIANGFTPQGREYVGIGDEYVTLDDKGGKRLASIHIFQEGHPAISEDRLFREYISSHEADKQLYIETKRRLFNENKENYEGYDTGKGEVLRQIKARAREWNRSQRL